LRIVITLELFSPVLNYNKGCFSISGSRGKEGGRTSGSLDRMGFKGLKTSEIGQGRHPGKKDPARNLAKFT
jgi:hypothetical protein